MGASVVIAPLQGLLSYFQRDRHHRDSQKDDALNALYLAVSRTLEYLEQSGGEKCFDRSEEFELSRLWGDAAQKVRHVSRGLALRLHDKADYWADQLEWSSEEVKTRQIELKRIRDELRRLLETT